MDIEVARDNLTQVQVHAEGRGALGPGDARVRVDGFALSSNNISYAVFGDALKYWDFFPASPSETVTWGRIPVWGFGEVVESRSDDAAVGERLYGYYPMSSELVLTPGRSDERGWTDVAPHRAAMAGAYSRYVRCAMDPLYRVDRERHQMLLFPLFYTSFVIDDFLIDNEGFGAGQIVVSSASSKTSIGVAFLAHGRETRVVGLTSAGNASFVEGLGVYDEVVTYDDVERIEQVTSVYVDVAGNSDVVHAVHQHLDGVLTHSMTVGGTHWDHRSEMAAGHLPGPRPEFFFAPTQISKRTQEWGRDGLDVRIGGAWDRYATWADGWIDFRHAAGPSEVIDVYRELLVGRADPRAGFICTLAGTAADGPVTS
jgi:hypothetical protein